MSETVFWLFVAWLSVDFVCAYLRRKAWSAMSERIETHERRLDTAAAHRGILTSRIDRLSRLETDGK